MAGLFCFLGETFCSYPLFIVIVPAIQVFLTNICSSSIFQFCTADGNMEGAVGSIIANADISTANNGHIPAPVMEMG